MGRPCGRSCGGPCGRPVSGLSPGRWSCRPGRVTGYIGDHAAATAPVTKPAMSPVMWRVRVPPSRPCSVGIDPIAFRLPPLSGAYKMAEGRFISYLRVSTAQQGRSGLGLEAQRQAVDAYLNGGKWQLIAEVIEIESGKKSDRPKLEEALALCKAHRAKLVIAKLDRLSRNVAFIA